MPHTPTMLHKLQKPTGAFMGASWISLFIGIGGYLGGLWNSSFPMTEKGYYFTVLMYGLFASISLQKIVRDRLEGIAVTSIYYGLSWVSIILSTSLLGVGLWNNPEMLIIEKGFFAMAFVLSLFASIAVQKNIRDLALYPKEESVVETKEEEDE